MKKTVLLDLNQATVQKCDSLLYVIHPGILYSKTIRMFNSTLAGSYASQAGAVEQTVLSTSSQEHVSS